MYLTISYAIITSWKHDFLTILTSSCRSQWLQWTLCTLGLLGDQHAMGTLATLDLQGFIDLGEFQEF